MSERMRGRLRGGAWTERLVRTGRDVRRRTGTGVPLVVRLAHLVLAVVVSWALSAWLDSQFPLWGFTIVVGLLAAVTVVDAEGIWSTATVGVIVGQYVVGTLSRFSHPPPLAGLLALVAGLYLVHATAALAAALPGAARTTWPVLGRWLLRTLVVLLAVLPFGLALPLLRPAAGDRGWIVLGVLAAAALVALPYATFRRRT